MRIALAGGAVAGLVVIAACSDLGGSKSITAPTAISKATTYSGGFAYSQKILLCVNGVTANWSAKYDTTGVHPSYGFSVLNNFPTSGGWQDHALNFVGGPPSPAAGYISGGTVAAGTCSEIYTASARAPVPDPETDAFAAIDIKIAGPAGATLVSTVCDIDAGLVNTDGTPYATHDGSPASPPNTDFYPDCDNDGDARVWSNFFHGSKVTFTFAVPTTVEPCNLGYPFTTSGNTRTSETFNESEVLSAFGIGPTALQPAELRAWYTDEHALTLGVDTVKVKTNPGGVITTTTYPISTMGALNPSSANPVIVGDMIVAGDQRATDGAERPLYPALFITDVTGLTDNLANRALVRANDWQFGGTPTVPNRVYGTWKSALVFLDKTKNPNTRAITPGDDPARNHQNISDAGGVNPPAGTKDGGWSAEVVWDFSTLTYNSAALVPGNTYRLQFMVHDGDQHHSGGDVGEACINLHWGG